MLFCCLCRNDEVSCHKHFVFSGSQHRRLLPAMCHNLRDGGRCPPATMFTAPKKTTDKLQRVLNSAARIVSNTHKFDQGLTHFRRSQLHCSWTLSTGFGLEFASRCSGVCTRWLLNTCLPTANPSPASLAVAPAIG